MHSVRTTRRLAGLVATMLAVLGLVGAQITPIHASTVSVGARNFSEEEIAGYLYGDVLKHHGYSVGVNEGFTTEAEVFAALESGSINVDADYLGNGYEDDGVANDQYKPGTSVKKVYAYLNKKFKHLKPPAEILTPSPKFNDQNVFVTTSKISKKYHLKTLSDLARLAPKLSFEVLHECTTRADCLKGFDSVYHPGKFKKYADPDAATTPSAPPFYGDLLDGKFDVVQGYGTVNDQPLFKKDHLVPLKDNKKMLPPDQFSPFVSVKLVKKHPSVVKWLNKVSDTITNANFAKMDAAAGAGKPAQQVADNFLKKHHLL